MPLGEWGSPPKTWIHAALNLSFPSPPLLLAPNCMVVPTPRALELGTSEYEGQSPHIPVGVQVRQTVLRR